MSEGIWSQLEVLYDLRWWFCGVIGGGTGGGGGGWEGAGWPWSPHSFLVLSKITTYQFYQSAIAFCEF